MNTAPDALALVIPAHNAARFLPDLFASVAALVEPFDELVVVDDGSTDDTASIAAAHGARVLRHERNAGCSQAKNTGLAAICSEWVHFHDADDLLEPGFTRDARAAIRQGACDVWLPRWRHVDATDGRSLGDSRLDAAMLAVDPVAVALAETINNVGAYRTSVLRACGGFDADPAVLHNEDRAFHLKLALAGARFATGDALGVVTRRFARGMSQANAVRCIAAHAEITRRYVAAHPGQHREICARAAWGAATGLASHRHFAEATAAARLAVALGFPVDPSAGRLFGWLCRLGPGPALLAREMLIRLFKPWLRP